MPEVVSLNDVVSDTEQLLRRSIGEHVELRFLLPDGVSRILADPGKLEQVLLNLAVNARDAMPTGGTLVIETANVEVDESLVESRPGLTPGPYVRLRVSDTGEGMDRVTIEHAFEPFYTTKAEGHGTGLGLATVYGIVAQMGGDVRLYSEPGIGTTCSVMLPATGERPLQAKPDALAMTHGGGATVLVVEDEDGIREVARRLLARRGFTVLTCADGTEAIALARSHEGPIELLITDVIMPGMMGREVAERLMAIRPGIRVIFMSGYAQSIIGSRQTLPAETILLEKPFGELDILAKVDEAFRRPAPTTVVQRSSNR